jgi:L-asparaginase
VGANCLKTQYLYFYPVFEGSQVGTQKKIVVLGTGGTIAGVAENDSDHTAYVAGQLGLAELVSAVPQLAVWGDRLQLEQVAQLDSKDMDHAIWQTLALRCAAWLAQPEVGAIVITHGTDTLEETAWFLQSVLASVKPVVLTCAMRPATALSPDGPQNLLDAITVAADPQAALQAPGAVLAVCAGRIHAAEHVSKVHPYRLDAFSSGEHGDLGWVQDGRPRWAAAGMPPAQAHPHARLALSRPVADWPWVDVMHSHAGVDARRLTALVRAGLQGLVIAGTGNGTVHNTLQTALQTALEQSQSQGLTVRLSTRCALGQIVGDPAALVPAPRGLNPYKARVSLMLDLMA